MVEVCAGTVVGGRHSDGLLTNADVVTVTEATCTDFDASVELRVAPSKMGSDAGVIVTTLATRSRSDERGSSERRRLRGTSGTPRLPRSFPSATRGLLGRSRNASVRHTATYRTASVLVTKKRSWR